jgi:hypothetical protein
MKKTNLLLIGAGAVGVGLLAYGIYQSVAPLQKSEAALEADIQTLINDVEDIPSELAGDVNALGNTIAGDIMSEETAIINSFQSNIVNPIEGEISALPGQIGGEIGNSMAGLKSWMQQYIVSGLSNLQSGLNSLLSYFNL